MTALDPIEFDPKTFFRKHFALPALPEVVSKIQGLIQSDNASMKQVAELVSGEPALVAQVLKVVNSAYYGLPMEIKDVKSAIVFLGLNEIYRMVLSVSVVNSDSILLYSLMGSCRVLKVVSRTMTFAGNTAPVSIRWFLSTSWCTSPRCQNMSLESWSRRQGVADNPNMYLESKLVTASVKVRLGHR